jgi:hypothetical protein
MSRDTHANQQLTATACPSCGESVDPIRTSTCPQVGQFREQRGEREGGKDGTLALKARPSAPRMMKPNTLRTVQQVARLELTTGRDMVPLVGWR